MITRAQKDAWIKHLLDPTTPEPQIGFSGRCALYYALPASDYPSIDEHWSAVLRLVGSHVYDCVATKSDCAVTDRMNGSFSGARIFDKIAEYIEQSVPTSD